MLYILRQSVVERNPFQPQILNFDWLKYSVAYGKPDKRLVNKDNVSFFDLIKAGWNFVSYLVHCSDKDKEVFARLKHSVVAPIFYFRDKLTIPNLQGAFQTTYLNFTFRGFNCVFLSEDIFSCEVGEEYYIVDGLSLTLNDPIDESCQINLVKAIKRVFGAPGVEKQFRMKPQFVAPIEDPIAGKIEVLRSGLKAENFGEYLKTELLNWIFYVAEKKFIETSVGELPTTVDKLFWLVVDAQPDRYGIPDVQVMDGILVDDKVFYLTNSKTELLDFLQAEKFSVKSLQDGDRRKYDNVERIREYIC